MAQVILLEDIDGRAELRIRDVSPPEPGPGDVRYEVEAFGLNRADILYMNSTHYTQTELPSRIGLEACGVVDAVGEGVTAFRVGDRVSAIPYADARYGVAGEFAITPAKFLMPWPDGFTAEEACSTWMQYLTAYFPLKAIADIGPGDWILVTAASSSAGIGAIQLARLLGARVVAATRTDAKRDFLLAIGADAVVATESEDVAAQILHATDGQGVRVVYDAVAGPIAMQYAEALADSAKIFVYGAMGGDMTIQLPILPLVRRDVTLNVYSAINHERHDDELERCKLFVNLAVESGRLRPIVDRVFPFDETAQAYAYMDTGVQMGKVVVRVKP